MQNRCPLAAVFLRAPQDVQQRLQLNCSNGATHNCPLCRHVFQIIVLLNVGISNVLTAKSVGQSNPRWLKSLKPCSSLFRALVLCGLAGHHIIISVTSSSFIKVLDIFHYISWFCTTNLWSNCRCLPYPTIPDWVELRCFGTCHFQMVNPCCLLQTKVVQQFIITIKRDDWSNWQVK